MIALENYPRRDISPTFTANDEKIPKYTAAENKFAKTGSLPKYIH